MADKYVLLPARVKRTYKNITKPKLKAAGRKSIKKRPPKGFEVSPITSGLTPDEIDKQIQSVLKKKNLLDYEKWRLLSQLSFRAIREAQKAAAAAAVSGVPLSHGKKGPKLLTSGGADAAGAAAAAVAQVSQRKPSPDIVEEVRALSGGLRPATVTKIMKFLDSPQSTPSNQLTWDKFGRLIIDGNMIYNSNIAELISDVVKPNRSVVERVIGDREFKTILHKLNFPYQLVSNKKKYYTNDEYRVFREQESDVAERRSGVGARRSRSGNLIGQGKQQQKWIKCIVSAS